MCFFPPEVAGRRGVARSTPPLPDRVCESRNKMKEKMSMRLLERGPESHLFPQTWSRGQLRNFFLHSEDPETCTWGGGVSKKHLTSSATVETRCFGGGLRRHDGERPIHAPLGNAGNAGLALSAMAQCPCRGRTRLVSAASRLAGGGRADGHDGRSWEEALMLTARFAQQRRTD